MSNLYKIKTNFQDPFLSVILSCYGKKENKNELVKSMKICYKDFKLVNKNFIGSRYNAWQQYLINKDLPSNYYCSYLDFILCNIFFDNQNERLINSNKNLIKYEKISRGLNDFNTFSKIDLGWLVSGIEYFKAMMSDGIKYVDIPKSIIKDYKKGDYSSIDNYSLYNMDKIVNNKKNIKILLLSDWASGTPQAKTLVKKIYKYAGGKNSLDMIFHLGDVYYSGTYTEQLDHITKIFNSIDPNIPVVNLAGNHDYYSGGQGYFDNFKNINNFQKTSYLCIRGEKVQFVCLDTSYFDSNPFDAAMSLLGAGNRNVKIDKNQKIWANRMIETAGDRKTIMLSHHELFSLNGGIKNGINTKLYNSFKKNLPNINAWYWGDKHSFIIYKKNLLKVKKARLIGAGAIPVSKKENPYKLNKNYTWIKKIMRKYKNKFNKYKIIRKTKFTKNKYTWNTVGTLLSINYKGEIKAEYLELPVTKKGRFLKIRKIYEENIL